MEHICVETERLRICPETDGEMARRIEDEPDAEMKRAYAEMRAGAERCPEQRLWYAVWDMRRIGSGESVGDLCFKGLGPDGTAELGYGMKKGFENQGYMTEAVRAMTSWALEQGAKTVEAETDPGNRASQSVLKKAGFLPTGEQGKEGPRFAYRGAPGAVIFTERLLLRPWREEDAEELYALAKDPRVGPAAGWPPHASTEDSRGIIRGVLSAPETYAVVLRGTGKPVGSAGIMRAGSGSAPMSASEAELGYWIGAPYWGRGLIPEAVRALLRRCFEELGCTAVWCGFFEGNERSRRVQEKCGFVPDHTEKDRQVAQLGETRTEHFTKLTRARWEKIR